MESVAVNEKESYWIRVRIVGGGYGEEAKYETTTEEQLKTVLNSADLASLTVEQKNRVALSLKNAGLVDTARYIPATFRPPSLKSLTLKYEYNERAQSGLHDSYGERFRLSGRQRDNPVPAVRPSGRTAPQSLYRLR